LSEPEKEEIMLRLKKQPFLSGVLKSVVILAILSVAIPVWADGTGDGKAKHGITAEEPPIYRGYPMNFDQTGYLDKIRPISVTIEDSSYGFTDNTGFYMPEAAHVPYSAFKPGDYVGILFNDKGKIKSIWLIKRK